MNNERSISPAMLQAFSQHFSEVPALKAAQSAFLHTHIQDAAMRWERFRAIDHHFSRVVTHEMEVTHQKQSGRCWLFAALNMLRILVGRELKIPQFEFSQNYLMFFDKLEKANFFLENILHTADEPFDARNVMFLLSGAPLGDGGQWHMFVNLVEKYGLVPQSAMPDTFQSCETASMNTILLKKLREFAYILREKVRTQIDQTEVRAIKRQMMQTIHHILQTCLGTPPTSFHWDFYDKDKHHHSRRNLTPLSFVEEIIPVRLSDYVCLINCPMSDTPYHKVFTVQFLGNVVERNVVRYVNLPIEQLKEYTIASLLKDEPVWFGCDVGQFFHRKHGIMDLDLYEFPIFLNTHFSMNKQQRLEHGESQMTHAMLFNGVDLVDHLPQKWRVENSWGPEYGKKGYLLMTDGWFDEFVYEVAIHKRFLPKEVIKLAEEDPITLPPWHPMGALA